MNTIVVLSISCLVYLFGVLAFALLYHKKYRMCQGRIAGFLESAAVGLLWPVDFTIALLVIIGAFLKDAFSKQD